MDMEKVIKGLEICYCPPAKCEDCPYHDLPDEQSCNDTLCLDALSLLKKQEPLEPITDGNEHIHVFRCRKCNRILQRNNEMDYCPKCGQAVKWYA